MSSRSDSWMTDRFAWFCLLFCVAFFVTENLNNKFELYDFEVYYNAAAKILAHEPFYNQAFGLPSGIYKYSPSAAFLFMPFCLFPLSTAFILYYLIISVIMYMTFQKALTLLKALAPELNLSDDWFKRYPILFISFFVLATALTREFHLGNVNLLLLFLSLIHIEQFLKQKWAVSGAVLAVIILIKPHFLVLVPLLLLTGRIIPLLYFSLFLVVGTLLPILYFGWTDYFVQMNEWFITMSAHNSSSELITHPNTVHHWLFKVVTPDFPQALNLATLLTTFGFVAFMIGIRRSGGLKRPEVFYALSSLVLISLIPNITVTDTEHFLLALPLIVYLSIVLQARPWTTGHWLIVASFILFGFNIYDVWGRELSALFEYYGLLGIGNFGIIILGIWNLKKMVSKTS